MCGRYAIWAEDDEVVRQLTIDELIDDLPHTFNACPGRQLGVVCESLNEGALTRRLRQMNWGFSPSWAKSAARPMINARAETVNEKPFFRAAVRARRALVVANGYYEWQTTAGGKQPFFITAADSPPSGPLQAPLQAFAAIYETRGDETGFAILTRAAPDSLSHIHDRAPVVVPEHFYQDWLDPSLKDKADVDALIDSLPAPLLHTFRAAKAVGNIRNDGPQLLSEDALAL